jgi:hypothetical protein
LLRKWETLNNMKNNSNTNSFIQTQIMNVSFIMKFILIVIRSCNTEILCKTLIIISPQNDSTIKEMLPTGLMEYCIYKILVLWRTADTSLMENCKY